MKVLRVFDEKNYRPRWNRRCREAVRAIIMTNNQIAMIKSGGEGHYKFPGGGMEAGETHLDTLLRETREETGLHLLPSSVKAFGMVREVRKDRYAEEIFDQKSYYYFAAAAPAVSGQSLSRHEQALGYRLEWTEIHAAYRADREIGRRCKASFLAREAYVLKLLLASAE